MKTTLEYLYYLLIWANYAYWPCLCCVWAWMRWSFSRQKVLERIALLDVSLYTIWWSKLHHLAMTTDVGFIDAAIKLSPKDMKTAILRQYFFMNPFKHIPHIDLMTYGIDRWDHREPWPKGKSWDNKRLAYWGFFKLEKHSLYFRKFRQVRYPTLNGRTRYKQSFKSVFVINRTKGYIPY